jgi:N-methylhydantoinase A
MSLAVRAVSINKGVDPRNTTIVAFGGGGPLHAGAIAREIFVPTVVIPKLPGTFSALGMLMASWRQDFVRTLIGRIGTLDARTVEAVFAELTAAGIEQITRDHIARADAAFAFHVNVRYVGQEHTIPIPVASPDSLTRDRDRLRDMFHAEHLKRYKQSAPDESMEVVSLRLVVTVARKDRIAENWLNEAWVAEGSIEESVRDVVFDDPARPLKARILWRPSLPAGMVIAGPAIVEEPTATTLVHPGDVATVHRNGHLLVAVSGSTR